MSDEWLFVVIAVPLFTLPRVAVYAWSWAAAFKLRRTECGRAK
jgi:hypothetical protein